jgi:hypothetical protein
MKLSHYQFQRCEGFTLVEILVSATIIAVLGVSVAGILASGGRAYRSTLGDNDFESFTDRDLATIRDTSFRMTCCAGSPACTTNLSTIKSADSCLSDSPGNQDYYFPSIENLDNNDTNPQITFFENRCTSGDLISDLLNEIKLKSPDNQVPSSLTRTFDTSEAGKNRLSVIYATDSITRAHTVTPTVAAWCP